MWTSIMLQLIITFIVIIFTTCLLLNLFWKYHISKLSFIPSAPHFPWLGTAPYLHKKPHLMFQQILQYSKKYGNLYIVWFAHIPAIFSSTVEYSEAVLGSKDMLKKSTLYWPLLEWLGTGLLTSYGSKWKQRRRAITPTFHFTILNDFVEIFTRQAESLVSRFDLKCNTGKAIDIQFPVSLAVLDVICETAMGVKTNAQESSNSDYAKAVFSLNGHLQKRQWNPWLWPKFIYQLTQSGKNYYKDLKILHDYTVSVINKRIESRKAADATTGDVPQKKAFLDMLLDLYDKGEIDVEGIREEVDTFMFEGHDTTAAGLSWIIYLLGRYPKVQEKLHQEIDKIEEKSGCLIDKLKECKYLDYVIKEGLRLHPPVALFARVLEQDTKIDGHIVPKGTEIGVFVKALHLNPKYWNEPEKFNPDRFGEDSFSKRNPYIYVPFSAGSRNCIGQKFAMLEEKIFLYHIMSKFRVESVQKECEVEESFEIIHRSTNGLWIKFFSR
ncbi:cytochrome P450 4V2-like [Hydractinia symbiolongicarpus]|uniref:cytochrome P450 4V2-like n=1 Tax=Hydractinia symbiolongicarpus TaxID=13093 RepID=UPI0025508343|nr:cytochrome P450 4V2-like [Hydractinia symbiolongicarpus]